MAVLAMAVLTTCKAALTEYTYYGSTYFGSAYYMQGGAHRVRRSARPRWRRYRRGGRAGGGAKPKPYA
eukprot:scaffold34984_cov60-Phaeocystis_antarctica.AAC.2